MTSSKHSESTPEDVARHGFTAPASTESDPLVAALEPVLAKYQDTRARRESLALLKVVRLSPSLEICEALLRGERVPRRRLDVGWLASYSRQ